MNQEIFSLIKKELKYIVLIFLASILIFYIAFFKENVIVLTRFVLSLYWLFVLPGYFAMLYWNEKLDFFERFVIGIAVSAGVIGILSYYIGLMGLNIKYHTVFLPLLIILFGFIFAMLKKKQA